MPVRARKRARDEEQLRNYTPKCARLEPSEIDSDKGYFANRNVIEVTIESVSEAANDCDLSSLFECSDTQEELITSSRLDAEYSSVCSDDEPIQHQLAASSPMPESSVNSDEALQVLADVTGLSSQNSFDL
jgi:hypothetical protein